jgi:hypothetical protein
VPRVSSVAAASFIRMIVLLRSWVTHRNDVEKAIVAGLRKFNILIGTIQRIVMCRSDFVAGLCQRRLSQIKIW